MIRTGPFERIYDPSVGESEAWYINDHTFVRDASGRWHLLGITHAEPAAPLDEKHLAHATAPSLRGPWTKQSFAMSADADAGETHLWAPHVVVHEGRYWMFVCAGGASNEAYRIHLATSHDCVEWIRHPSNPLVVDGFDARDPMVSRIGGRWVMYYTATSAPSGGHHVVKAVGSDDLVRWGEPSVVYTDPETGTFGGPTESPFVVERPDGWYLFIGPDWDGILAARKARDREASRRAYRRTRVFHSDDPLAFSPAGHVATIDAHAAEVVRDEDGSWWVSSCGWGRGGVYLAPLLWD